MKEAIALLEKAKHKIDPKAHIYCQRDIDAFEYIDQALALLKQPKCKTCGNSGRMPTFDQASGLADAEPCPDCQQPKDQPSSEFTKKFRELIKLSEEHLSDNKIGRLQTYGKESCGRLDTSEASRKELLDLCKEFMEKADNGSADFDDPEPGSIYLRAKAAIDKAEKES